MKNKLFIVVLTILFSSQLFAEDMCNPECSIVIDFPTGGTILAVEALTLTFGESGFIDTGDTITNYIEDQVLILNAGESIIFSSGGSLDIGTIGNIEHTDLNVTTSGVFDINAIGDVSIEKLILNGTGILSINAAGNIALGEVDIPNGSMSISTPEGGSSGCETNQGVGISISSVPAVIIEPDTTCDLITEALGVGLFEFTGVSLVISLADEIVEDTSEENFASDEIKEKSSGSLTLSSLLFLITLSVLGKFSRANISIWLNVHNNAKQAGTS